MKGTLVLLTMLGVTGIALASPQAPAGPPARAAHWHTMMHRMEQQRMERLTVLLDLTPAQQGRVKAILSAEHAKIRHSMRQVIEQARATHKAVREETLAKLSAVLSPGQMKKFKLLMPGRPMGRWHGGHRTARMFGPGAR